jgi:hypothetical protein
MRHRGHHEANQSRSRVVEGQRSRRRLGSAADGHLELSWSRVAVDRVTPSDGETWAEVQLTPRPARNLCLVPLGLRDVGCL